MLLPDAIAVTACEHYCMCQMLVDATFVNQPMAAVIHGPTQVTDCFLFPCTDESLIRTAADA